MGIQLDEREKDELHIAQTVLLSVVAVAAVGILASNMRTSRFTRKLVKESAQRVLSQQNAIIDGLSNGKEFYHFPGIGVITYAASS